MRTARFWLASAILLALATVASAQVELVYKLGGEEHVVAGFRGGRPAYDNGEKFVPVSGEGQWEIRPAAGFAKPQGLVEASYYFQLVNRQAQPAGSDETEVFYQIDFLPVESVKGIYGLVAWEADGKLTQVAVRNWGEVDPKRGGEITGRISIKPAERKGFLRAYLFQEGKSLGGLVPAEMDFATVRAALDAGDFAAVTTWLNGPGRTQSLPKPFFMPLARMGEAALLELALSGPGAKHVKGDEGKSILLAAAETGREDCVKLLLQKGVNANAADDREVTALARAIRANSELTVLALLAAKADPEHFTGRDFNPARNCAFKSGNAGLTKLLLERGMKLPEPADLDGYFLDAVGQQQVEMAALILERAKNPGALLNRPVLLLAALNSDHAMLKMLLAAGAKINVSDPKGVTAIMGAAYAGDAEAVGWLEQAGASLTARDGENRTAASWAWKGGHDELTARLLRDAPPTNPDASRLLYEALLLGRPAVAAVLLAQGASVDLEAVDTDDVLAAIVRAGNLPTLTRAMERGLKADRPVYRDWNLAGLARRYHQTEMLMALEKQAGHPLEARQPAAANLPLEVFTRGSGPTPAEGGALEGDARVDIYVDADGVPCAPLLVSSSNEKVGRAALANVVQWRFNRLSEPARPWRRMVVPMEFSTANATGGQLWDVEVGPLPREPAKVTDAATQVREAAWVHFTISASGAVVLPRVMSMTSPGLEEDALKLVRSLKYYPAQKNQTNVAYPAEGVLLMPAGVMIEANRLTYLGEEDFQPQIKKGLIIKTHPKSLEAAQRRVMILASVVIDRKGNVKQFSFLGSPDGECAKEVEKLFHGIQFKSVVIKGVAMEYPATLAFVFGRSND